jgi:transglutaminase-like putative cysteine protease
MNLATAPAATSRPASAPAAEPTGASPAFTTDDPLVRQARDLMREGKFNEAQALLASGRDGRADAQAERARAEMKEIIRRVRQDYDLDAAALLARIQKDIPDATAADLERWTKANEAQHRIIDGEVKYFGREPVNLYRFSEEARWRRAAHEKPDPADPAAWTLVKHLQNVIAAAGKTGQTEVLPIKHRITFTLTIDPNRPGAQSGSVVRAWLPFPQSYRQQKDVTLVSTRPAYTLLAPNATDFDGPHRVGGAPQRTVYFEQKIDDPTKPITFEEVFELTSYAYYPVLKDELAQPLPADWGDAYLTERPPHIVFSPELKQTVAKIVGDETNPLAKVRKIFHWIDANIRYHAEVEYTTIPSFSLACLSRHKGDCGIQSMLFITMCRAAGVPARWQSGWETKRAHNSMHDWTEVYIAPWGWLPCDPSYGVQSKSDDPKVRDFYIGHQDSYRLIFNLDYGSPLHPPKESMRSEPADFQRGEAELDGRNLYFDEWDYDCKIEWLTPEP